jgi:hypothetical protein
LSVSALSKFSKASIPSDISKVSASGLKALEEKAKIFGMQPLIETFTKLLEESLDEDENTGFVPMIAPLFVAQCMESCPESGAGKMIFEELKRKT